MKTFRDIVEAKLKVELHAHAEDMQVETCDVEGNTLRRDDVYALCKMLRYHPRVAVLTAGYDVGGTHDDGSFERLPLTKDVPVYEADMEVDADREACADALADLLHEAATSLGLDCAHFEVHMP